MKALVLGKKETALSNGVLHKDHNRMSEAEQKLALIRLEHKKRSQKEQAIKNRQTEKAERLVKK